MCAHVIIIITGYECIVLFATTTRPVQQQNLYSLFLTLLNNNFLYCFATSFPSSGELTGTILFKCCMFTVEERNCEGRNFCPEHIFVFSFVPCIVSYGLRPSPLVLRVKGE